MVGQMGAAGVGLVVVRRRLRGREGVRSALHVTTATINAMTSMVRMIRRSILCCPVLHFVCLGLAMEPVNVLRPRVDAVPVLDPRYILRGPMKFLLKRGMWVY